MCIEIIHIFVLILCFKGSFHQPEEIRWRPPDIISCEDDSSCPTDQVCDSQHLCTLAKEADCQGDPLACLEGATCEEGKCLCNATVTDPDTPKCDPLLGQVGGRCNATSEAGGGGESLCVDPHAACTGKEICECPEGYVVNFTTLACKESPAQFTPQLKTCTGNESFCPHGQKCVNGKCILVLKQSPCKKDDACMQGMVCDSRQSICALANGSDCRAFYSMCVSGSTCFKNQCQCHPTVTDPNTHKCESLAGRVGGQCKAKPSECVDPHATCNEKGRCQCSEGYSMNPTSLTCGIVAGSKCQTAASSTRCVLGSSCIEGKCGLNAGQSCSGSNVWNCRVGTVCGSDELCRLGLRQHCSADPSLCVNDTVCDSLHKCKRNQMEQCSQDDECVAGAICHGGVCRCSEIIASIHRGTCAPRRNVVAGKCAMDDYSCADPHAYCSHLAVCRCRAGFEVDPRILTCKKTDEWNGTKGVNEDCRSSSECARGNKLCDPLVGKCKIPLGESCAGRNKDNCPTRAICDVDTKCRVNLNQVCSGRANVPCRVNSFCDKCRRGTYCDMLGQCRHFVDEDCSSESCVAGAVCFRGKCTCDPIFAHKNIKLCVPKDGWYNGSCRTDGSCRPNMKCDDFNICDCTGKTGPNRRYECESLTGHSTGGEEADQTNYLAIALGLVGGCVLVAAFAGVGFKQQYSNSIQPNHGKGQGELRDLRQLRANGEAKGVRGKNLHLAVGQSSLGAAPTQTAATHQV